MLTSRLHGRNLVNARLTLSGTASGCPRGRYAAGWYALEIPAANRVSQERRSVGMVAFVRIPSLAPAKRPPLLEIFVRLSSMNQRLAPPGDCRWLLAWDLVVVWIAHSHSGSQSLRHLPWHSNSIMLPPHCGQTKLMIEEIKLALSSPGSVSIVLMFALLIVAASLPCDGDSGSQLCEAQPRTAYDDNLPVGVAPKRSRLVGRRVRQVACAGCRLAQCVTQQTQCQMRNTTVNGLMG